MSYTNLQRPSTHAHTHHYAAPHQLKSLDNERSSSSIERHSQPAAMEVRRGHVSPTVEEPISEEDHDIAAFRQLFISRQASIDVLFGRKAKRKHDEFQEVQISAAAATTKSATVEPPTKRVARTIDEDDYDDDEDDDADREHASLSRASPSRNRGGGLLSPSKSGSSPPTSDKSPTKAPINPSDTNNASQTQPPSAEEVRKKLEEDKKAIEDAAKRSFSTMIYTFEHDRTAMLEQQRLEDSEKQIDADLDHSSNPAVSGTNAGAQGTLSNTNLGASSLTLKHLIARIDLKRDRVRASDAELRSLMNEVRRNRSKWANEDQVGQEELYESAEKVLNELKAMTQWSTPFLTRVNKREAPDYYVIIKTPMDMGTMTKKLKTLQYKSKADFVADLNLIWNNCLKYNGNMSHPLRKNANAMMKEAEKLTPLIPDIIIRSRAAVEAEERRKHNGGDDDAADDSDDEPIMSSRGRKAPGKTGAKGGSAPAVQSTTIAEDGTPVPEQKPNLHLNGVLSAHREGSEFGHDGSSNGFATPGNGSQTPGGHGHQAGDAMDIDGPSLNGIALDQALSAAAEDLQEDEEFKIWKQVTKKDRAIITRERHNLFKDDRLNPEAPALLRTKAGMRWWLRQQKQDHGEAAEDDPALKAAGDKSANHSAETLAEEMEGEEERVLPDYYDPLSTIPDIPEYLRWVEDDKGQVIDNAREECLRIVPKGYFTAPKGVLTAKIEANMRQMQETRKVCSKIGVVKQMQLQAQMYSNQFHKYNPQPFVEADIEGHVVSDDFPVMANWTCRAVLQRSVGKLCYHAGFEETQPSAIDVMSDIVSDYMDKLFKTFVAYLETPRIPATGAAAEAGQRYQNRFTDEEILLHTMHEYGMDIEGIQSYAQEENEKIGNKLAIMHERMKAHLADLLRPALGDNAGADGVGAFNDGSEQFVGGDFAEDLGEDFFGFKELGLDAEFSLSSLSVPLHLLQSKVHSLHNASSAAAGPTASQLVENLPPLAPVTITSINDEIGMIKNFFLAKLHANNDEALIEDEDLPTKQRLPKPRLPTTGKITSPRKRPGKEQHGNAKKKKKLENGVAMDISPEKPQKNNNNSSNAAISPEKGGKKATPILPRTPSLATAKKGANGLNGDAGQGMERVESSQGGESGKEDGERDEDAPMSPESIDR